MWILLTIFVSHLSLQIRALQKRSNKIELTKKLGIPKESIQPKGLTRKQLQELDREFTDDVKVAPVRRKDETPEEKRERKALVKEERKVCQQIIYGLGKFVQHSAVSTVNRKCPASES